MINSNNTSSPISAEEARSTLEPYLVDIHSCFADGWRKWLQMLQDNPLHAATLTDRTRASFVNDQIWHAVKTKFSGVQGVYLVEAKGLRVMCIQSLALRFKKLDRDLRYHNIETMQQKTLMEQLPIEQLFFEGFPLPVHLIVGYVLDRLKTSVQAVHVTMWKSNALLWHFTIAPVSVLQPVVPQVVPAISVVPMDAVRDRKSTVKINMSKAKINRAIQLLAEQPTNEKR